MRQFSVFYVVKESYIFEMLRVSLKGGGEMIEPQDNYFWGWLGKGRLLRQQRNHGKPVIVSFGGHPYIK